MATLSFYLRNDKNPTQVYAHFSVSRNLKFRNSTGYMVNPKIWKNGMPNKKYIDGAELYNILADLEKFIYSKFNNADLHKNWLEETIREFKGESIKSKDSLIEYFEKYIESAHKRKNYKGGVGLSRNRIKVLETSIKMIDRFEKYQGKKWLLSEINKQQIEEFQKWQLNQGFSPGYSGMNLTNIKTVCKFADKEGANVNPHYLNIPKIKSSKSAEDVIYLTFEELNAIKTLTLHKKHLENARRWLLIGCYTGQRASDLLNLTEKNIKQIGERKVFELTQIKTGKRIAVPILPEVEEIIKLGFPTKLNQDKFNFKIKVICKEAGINEIKTGREKSGPQSPTTIGKFPKWKLISTHVCRRSFATNFYGKIPTPILMSITGHSKEETFLNYIGKTAYENALKMFDYL